MDLRNQLKNLFPEHEKQDLDSHQKLKKSKKIPYLYKTHHLPVLV